MTRPPKHFLVETLVMVAGALVAVAVAVIVVGTGVEPPVRAASPTSSTQRPPSTERQSSPRRSTTSTEAPVSVPVVQTPTPEALAGIWVIDREDTEPYSGLMVGFGLDGTVAFDRLGRLDINPTVRGSYSVLNNTISFTVGPDSSGCVQGDTFAWRASVSTEGRMNSVTVEDGTGSCRTGVGIPVRWTRVSPASPAGTALTAPPTAPTPTPPRSAANLLGIWLLEGSGRLLRFAPDGTYAIDDRGNLGIAPGTTGTFSLDGNTLTLTTVQSATCPPATTQMWSELRLAGDTLRAMVHDGCAPGIDAHQAWIRLSP